jgi:hypothetical protein
MKIAATAIALALAAFSGSAPEQEPGPQVVPDAHEVRGQTDASQPAGTACNTEAEPARATCSAGGAYRRRSHSM